MNAVAAANIVELHPHEPSRPLGLLPWEDASAFAEVQGGFNEAYSPEGPVEVSLIDRLVWIEWRRRRLLAAEAAVHTAHAFDRAEDSHAKGKTLIRAGVTDHSVRAELSIGEILRGSDEDDAESIAAITEGLANAASALACLTEGGKLDAAIGELDTDGQEWWAEASEETNDDGSRTWAEGVEGFQAWLTKDALPWRKRWLAINENRPAIRAQAIAESLDPPRIRQIWEMESRLDRQFEKALSMLIRLREMRSIGEKS